MFHLLFKHLRLISSEGIVRNDTRAHCELEFDKSHGLFMNLLLDDHNIVVIEKFSEQWFTSKFPIDVVEEFYKTPVKIKEGVRILPSLRLRFQLTEERFHVTFMIMSRIQ